MRAMILALGLAFGLCAGRASAADASFKDWWAVCDNTRECAAFGFSEEASEGRAYIRLTRGAGAVAAPVIEIVTELEAPAWRVQVDGGPVAGVGALPRQEDRIRLPAAPTAALLAAIAQGSTLEIVGGDRVAGVSLAGSSAALRWLDDQQGRAGTVTAMVATGAKPGSAVPSAPALPLVRAAAPVSQDGLPTGLPKSVQALMTGCEADIGERVEIEPVIARLAPGVILYAPPCYAGAYNIVHALIVADEQGGGARLLPIRYETGEPTSELMNIHFDPDRQVLSNFEKGRGLGDCGALNTWVWTGEAFQLIEQMRMGECRGVPADDWPITFRAGNVR